MGNKYNKLIMEAQRSPGKAALLVIVSVVGCLIWGRQLIGLFGTTDPRRVVTEQTKSPDLQESHDPAPTESPQDKAASEAPLPFWNDLKRWMDEDPKMEPANLPADFRSPFYVTAEQNEMLVVKDEIPVAGADVEAHRSTPLELGLTVETIVISKGDKLARIGGRFYREHSMIQGVIRQPGSDAEEGGIHASSSPGYEIELVSIERDSVVLRSDKQQYKLNLRRRPNVGKNIVVHRLN